MLLNTCPVWAEDMDDWLSYDRPATYESIVTSVSPVMRDGIALDCQMAVPAMDGHPAPGQFPGIITNVIPYTILIQTSKRVLEYWAGHGYQALTCNVRGTGKSEGFYLYNNQPEEWCDSYDLVEWLAEQPGSNGRIGQEGTSYGGMTSYQAAIGNPPHLEAIAPQIAPRDLYLDDAYPGGVKKRPGVTDTWPLVVFMTTYGQVPANRVWDAWLDHPTHDAFWDGIAIEPKLDNVDVPVFVVSGWEDYLFTCGALRNYETLVQHGRYDTTWLLAGPWPHINMFETDVCTLPGACVPEELRLPQGILLGWFDHWLQDRSDAPLPPSHVVTYEGPREVGDGWQMFDQWPPDDAVSVNLALRRDGSLGTEPGRAGTRSFYQHPLSGILWAINHETFTSPPLDQDIVLAGDIELSLTACYTKSDANIHAELYELLNGQTRLINDGWLKISHRDSHVTPTPVVPGQVITSLIEIRPVHQRIPAGAQLQLKISGGGGFEMIPVKEFVRTDIVTGTGGSTLRLTVRGGYL